MIITRLYGITEGLPGLSSMEALKGLPEDNKKKRLVFNAFKPVADGRKAHERVASQLKDAILGKKFVPGQRIPSERELADTFRTSRVTVRSAILTLKNTGLLRIKKGMGGGTFVVSDMTGESVSDLLRDIIKWKDISIENVIEVRTIIEPQIAFLAAKNATADDSEAIWATIRELAGYFKIRKSFRATDENFHRALANAAKNPLLSLFQSSLVNVLFKFIYGIVWNEEHKTSILRWHTLIAEKVEKKDPNGAMQAMVEHLADMQGILAQCSATKTGSWINKSL